jgi:hypothetical protein
MAALGRKETMKPQGIYYLNQVNQPIAALALQSPVVDGITIRQTWVQLVKNGLDYLEAQALRCRQAQKQYALCIIAGRATPAECADSWFTYTWAARDGEETQEQCPVPWDPAYLANLIAMYARLAENFGTDALLKHIKLNVLCSHTEEEYLPRAPADIFNWASAGYTRKKCRDAFMKVLAAVQGMFQNTGLITQVIPNAFPALDDAGNHLSALYDNQLTLDILNATTGNGFCGAQNNGLTPDWHFQMLARYRGKMTTGFQELAPISYTPAQVTDMLNQAAGNGANFVELYPETALNPNYQAAIAAARLPLAANP